MRVGGYCTLLESPDGLPIAHDRDLLVDPPGPAHLPRFIPGMASQMILPSPGGGTSPASPLRPGLGEERVFSPLAAEALRPPLRLPLSSAFQRLSSPSSSLGDPDPAPGPGDGAGSSRPQGALWGRAGRESQRAPRGGWA